MAEASPEGGGGVGRPERVSDPPTHAKLLSWQVLSWQDLPWQVLSWQVLPRKVLSWQVLPRKVFPWQVLSWQVLPRKVLSWQDLRWQDLYWQVLPWQDLPRQVLSWEVLPRQVFHCKFFLENFFTDKFFNVVQGAFADKIFLDTFIFDKNIVEMMFLSASFSLKMDQPQGFVEEFQQWAWRAKFIFIIFEEMKLNLIIFEIKFDSCRHVWAPEIASRISEFFSSECDFQTSEGFPCGEKCTLRKQGFWPWAWACAHSLLYVRTSKLFCGRVHMFTVLEPCSQKTVIENIYSPWICMESEKGFPRIPP